MRRAFESHDYSGHYAIDLIDKGTITINPAMSDFSNVTYKLLIFLNQFFLLLCRGTVVNAARYLLHAVACRHILQQLSRV